MTNFIGFPLTSSAGATSPGPGALSVRGEIRPLTFRQGLIKNHAKGRHRATALRHPGARRQRSTAWRLLKKGAPMLIGTAASETGMEKGAGWRMMFQSDRR
jgi:hypothetical protein